jgi:hypothetical protein
MTAGYWLGFHSGHTNLFNYRFWCELLVQRAPGYPLRVGRSLEQLRPHRRFPDRLRLPLAPEAAPKVRLGWSGLRAALRTIVL